MIREASLRLLLTADAVGGVWQYATDLAQGLSGFGVTAIIAVMGPAPNDAQRAAANDAGLQSIDTGLPLDWLAGDAAEVERAGHRLAQLAGDLGVDVVQLNAPALGAFGGFGVPVIAVSHSCVGTWWRAVEGRRPLPADLAWRADLHGRGLRAADRVVAPSAAHAAATAELYDLPGMPAVVHNGRAVFAAAAQPADCAEPVLTAGRLWDRGKNVALLDRVAAMLPEPVAAAGATVGPHGETIALANMRHLGQLADRDLASRLATRPVFVSPARYEPFGLAVLEAAAAGCPLVLADIPTFRELWGDAATFVSGDDEAAWVGAIRRLLDEPDEREASGNAARRTADRFTVARMASRMAEIVSELASASQHDPKRVAA